MSRHLVSWLLVLVVSWPCVWAQEGASPGSDLERLFRVLVAKHRQRLPPPPVPGTEVTLRPLTGGPVTGVVRAITPSRVQLETEHGRVWVPAQGVAPESLAALFPDRAALLLALRDFDLLKKARAAGGAEGGWGVGAPAGDESKPGRSEPEAVPLPAEPESVPLPADAGKLAPGAPVVFDLTPAKSPAALKPVVAAFGQWLGFQQQRVGGRLASAVHAKRQGAAAVLYVTVAPEFQMQDYDIRYQIAEGMWYFWAFRGAEMGVVPHPERAYLVLVSPGGRIAGGSSPDGAAKLWVEEKPPKERPVKPEPASAPEAPTIAESASPAAAAPGLGEAPVPPPPVAQEPVAAPAAPAEETAPTLPVEIPSDKAALIAAYAGKTPLWLATPWAADSQRRVPQEIAAHGNATLTLPAELPAGTLVLRVLLEYEPDIRRRGGNALAAYGWRWPAIGPDGKEAWAGQFLRLRLNDQLVWARWRTETQRLLTVMLPGDLRNPGREDKLMCENDADAPLAIVALWAERPAPGAPVWVALGGLAWAERPETWRRIPVVVEELSLPPQPVAAKDSRASWEPPFKERRFPNPPSNLFVPFADSAGRSRPTGHDGARGGGLRNPQNETKVLGRGLGSTLFQKGGPNERPGQAPTEVALDTTWRPVLERVKAGGARVVVRCEVRNEGEVESLAVAGARYGAQVLAWQLRVANGNLGRTAVERLRRVCPNAQVAVDTLPARGSRPTNSRRWRKKQSGAKSISRMPEAATPAWSGSN
ncbi:MAG: hypothetical protein WC708_21130 [Lentisphaeria bacterium]